MTKQIAKQSSSTRAQVLLDSILEQPKKEIYEILHAAAEAEGNMYDRFAKAYREITGAKNGSEAGT